MQRANYARGLRFLPKVVALTTVGLISAAIAYQATAQVNVYTDPVGFITLTSVASGYSYQGLGLTQIPALRGAITAVSGTQVTLNSALTAGQYNAANVVGATTEPSYFIEYTSGAMIGVTDDILSNDTAAVYTSTADGASAGDTFKIYPHWTIGTVFGPTNQAGYQGGASVSTADNILVWNPITQGPVQYWYKTSTLGGGTGWRQGATTFNAANAVLYIEQGFSVLRRAASPVSVQLVGGVKLSNTVSFIYGPSKYTYAGNVEAAGIPLGASGLYTGNPATGVQGGASVSTADNVLIWNPTTQGPVQYWYKTSTLGGGTGWRQGALTSDASTNTIPLGGMAKILRRSGSGFNWTIPAQY
jgi:uncharacterized protein (TIGR02597 family)